mgnify:FL=1
MEELKEKSDSESFDDEREKLLNIRKAREAELLGEKVKNLENDLKMKDLEHSQNLKRLE